MRCMSRTCRMLCTHCMRATPEFEELRQPEMFGGPNVPPPLPLYSSNKHPREGTANIDICAIYIGRWETSVSRNYENYELGKSSALSSLPCLYLWSFPSYIALCSVNSDLALSFNIIGITNSEKSISAVVVQRIFGIASFRYCTTTTLRAAGSWYQSAEGSIAGPYIVNYLISVDVVLCVSLESFRFRYYTTAQ